MDCCGRFDVGTLVHVLPAVKMARIIPANCFQNLGVSRTMNFQGILRFCQSNNFSSHRLSSFVTLARIESNESDYSSLGTPLELRTPEGKFLCDILKNQPHIFQAAAQKQLEELAFERESAFARWEISQGSHESSLHGRIANMKENDCQHAVEEVMYMLIVHNFYKIKVPMVPNLSKCTNNNRLDILSSKDQELGSIHGNELLEMVREHLSNILRLQGKSDSTCNLTTIKIERLQLGRLYAASIMYGYFLKSVSLRHSLELSLSSNDNEDVSWDQMVHLSRPRFRNQATENAVTLGRSADNVSSLYAAAQREKADKLRCYMMGFNSSTLKLCSKLRSFEAANLIENHSWALFGNPDSSSIEKDEVFIFVSGLKRLILEAVAFGTFLWDVEWYVDSKYRLKDN